MNHEENMHAAVCRWLALAYPDVLFNSDMSGVRLPMKLAVKAAKLRSSRAMPDLAIYHAARDYNGLFLELKRNDARVLLKDGTLSTDQHLQEQAEILMRLGQQGYAATFAVGFDQTKAIIDWYLGDSATPMPVAVAAYHDALTILSYTKYPRT